MTYEDEGPSRIMRFNPNTFMIEWYDGSDVPAEIFDSLFDVNDKMKLGTFFYLQDLRKQRLETKLKYQNEEKPA